MALFRGGNRGAGGFELLPQRNHVIGKFRAFFRCPMWRFVPVGLNVNVAVIALGDGPLTIFRLADADRSDVCVERSSSAQSVRITVDAFHTSHRLA